MKLYKANLKNKDQVDIVCQMIGLKNYSINDDLSVDVDGNVYFEGQDYDFIPVKFGKVSGSFNISKNNLDSLENCPHTVGKDFICERNNLSSTKNSPKFVGGSFNCSKNKIKSLEGFPKTIGRDVILSSNYLKSVKEIKGQFHRIDLSYNYLEELDFNNTKIKWELKLNNNNLFDLKGLPELDRACIDCENNELSSLEGVPAHIDEIYLSGNHKTSRQLIQEHKRRIEQLSLIQAVSEHKETKLPITKKASRL